MNAKTILAGLALSAACVPVLAQESVRQDTATPIRAGSVQGVDVPLVEYTPYLSVFCYPNPARNNVTVRVNNPGLARTGIQSIKIYTYYGAELDDITSQLRGRENEQQVNMSIPTTGLPTGVYVVAVDAGKQTTTTILCVVR